MSEDFVSQHLCKSYRYNEFILVELTTGFQLFKGKWLTLTKTEKIGETLPEIYQLRFTSYSQTKTRTQVIPTPSQMYTLAVEQNTIRSSTMLKGFAKVSKPHC